MRTDLVLCLLAGVCRPGFFWLLLAQNRQTLAPDREADSIEAQETGPLISAENNSLFPAIGVERCTLT
jgi:hypothetical protein